jgi:hypothetical protein
MLNQEADILAQKTLFVSFDEQYLEDLRGVIKSYINLQVMNWE